MEHQPPKPPATGPRDSFNLRGRLIDEPADNETVWIGDVVRLEIPLRSVQALRRVAEELHGLATRLDCISRFSTERPAMTMLEVYRVVRQCNRKLDRVRGRGRPKKSRNKF